MTIYVANVNGDWWELTPSQPIFVLDTDELTEEQFRDILDEYGELEGDKFEDAIQEYGRETTLNVY